MHFVNQALVLKKFQLTLSRRLSCYRCYRENLGDSTLFPKKHNLPMTLKFEQSPFFGIHVAHISNNAPFIPIYFASETWLLETTSQPANLFTLKMNTNLRCRVPNSKAVNTQLYTTRWDCKYRSMFPRKKKLP